jgi:hypothetical protein
MDDEQHIHPSRRGLIWLGRDVEIMPKRKRYRLSLLTALYSLLEPPMTRVCRWRWHLSNKYPPAAALLGDFIFQCSQSSDRLIRLFLRSAKTTALWRNPYFDRRWVYSEMLLARSKRVFVGSISISWTELSLLYKQIPETPTFGENRPIWRVLNTEPQANVPLLQSLKDFKHTVCQEHRDYVYAFLATCGNGSAFPIDYNCDLYELLLGTALFCICHRKLGVKGDNSGYLSPFLKTTISELADVWNIHEQVSSIGVMKTPVIREVLVHYTDEGHFSVSVEQEFRMPQFRRKTVAHYLSSYVQPRERSRGSDSLAVPVSHAQAGHAYLERICAASGVTHILFANGQLPLILLSQREQALDDDSCFEIRGLLHVTWESNRDRPVYTFTSEIYRSNGLPGLFVKQSSLPSKDTVFVWSDLRAPLILLGLPSRSHQQGVRVTALDILHDPNSFPLPPIAFERVECPELWSSDYTLMDRTTWLPPGTVSETSADGPGSRS